MSVELVNRIAIKPDGVYINTHSNNDTAPFHSVKLKHISELYTANSGAQWRKKQALKEFVKMFSWYGSFRLVDYRPGEHESIRELRAALDACYHINNKAQEQEHESVADIIKNSEYYNENEKQKIIDVFYETFDTIAIEQTAEYYLKNDGGKRFRITEDT